MAKQPLKASHRDNFVATIRAEGYQCREYSRGYFVGEDTRGLVFRVECDSNALRYLVIITPYNKIIVKPVVEP